MSATRSAIAFCLLLCETLLANIEPGPIATVSNVNALEVSTGWRNSTSQVLNLVSISPAPGGSGGSGNQVTVHSAPQANGFNFGVQEVKITTQSAEVFSLSRLVTFIDSFGREQSSFALIDGGFPVAYCTVNGTNWTRVQIASQPVYGEIQLGYTKSGLFSLAYNAATKKAEFFAYNDRTGTFSGAGFFPPGSEMIDGAIWGGPRISFVTDPKDAEELFWMTFAIGIDYYLSQNRRTLQGIEERSRTKLDIRPQTGTVTESKLTHAGGDTYASMTINDRGKYQINFSSKLFSYPPIEVGDARPGVVGGMTLENYGENALYFGMETPAGYFLRKALKNPFGISVYDSSPVTTTVPSRSASPLDLTSRPFDWMSPDRSLYTVYSRSLHVAKMKGCRNSRSRLCSANDRFEVSVDWRDPEGRTGRGRAIQLTGDTGYFWFFDEKNIEMVVKVLDGCGVNQRYWVFAGGLTNVQADITVHDTLTGAVKTYRNPLNTPFQPIQDTGAFAGCSAGTSAPVNVEFYPATPRFEIAQQGNCSPGATTLCLGGRRFRLQATYRTNDGKSGTATAVSLTDDSGYFWFFDRENVELIAKVLNGCGVNNRQWVFAGGLTNVEVEMTVTDTVTGATKRYTNPQDRPFAPIQDTGAFASCQ